MERHRDPRPFRASTQDSANSEAADGVVGDGGRASPETVTVTTTGATVYGREGASASASAVQKGSFIVAEGNQHSATSLTATSIDIAPSGPGGPAAAKAGPPSARLPGRDPAL